MIQGVPIKCSIDLADLGTFSDVQFELYSSANKHTIATAKYLNPSSSQYPITKVGTVYSFTIPGMVTESLIGDYGFEMTYFDSEGEVIDKAQVTGLSIERESR